MSIAYVEEDADPGEDDGKAGQDTDRDEEILGDDSQLRLGVYTVLRRAVTCRQCNKKKMHIK